MCRDIALHGNNRARQTKENKPVWWGGRQRKTNEKNHRKTIKGKQTKVNKQRETSTGKERNKGHLHWVKEEEHDEEGDRGPKGKTHRLHAVQGCHTVLSPAKYILVLDFEMFFAHRIFVLLAFCTLFWGFNLFCSAVKQDIQPISIITSVSYNKCIL